MGRLEEMVGMTGFEPATSASRTQRSTKLSHIPLFDSEGLQSDLPDPSGRFTKLSHIPIFGVRADGQRGQLGYLTSWEKNFAQIATDCGYYPTGV